ncbi:MAG: AAA family ATPase [Planctomycetota bacterium]
MAVSSDTLTSEPFSDLFERVNLLLGEKQSTRSAAPAAGSFVPRAPATLREAGVSAAVMERIIMRFLLQAGSLAGRRIGTQLRLPFRLVEPVLRQLRTEKHIDLAGTTAAGDCEYLLTPTGRDRALQYVEECSYFGAAPVPLSDYTASVAAQSPSLANVQCDDLRRVFRGLVVSDEFLQRLGPAVNAGRGLFLYGRPGNGKTTLAERMTDVFGSTIWIPRAVAVDTSVIRIFDPSVHVEVDEHEAGSGFHDTPEVDRRWVLIRRPTVIAGGELTMNELEIQINPASRICEAPLQVKSNCGTLVIDDFGRQQMPVDQLLNRWIIPLEKRYDFLNLPTGRKVKFPFDQMIIFSTNCEPRDLVDEAFLRRIPYKIEVPDPTQREFRQLFELMCEQLRIPFDPQGFEYLVQQHYKPTGRPFRACQARDILLQIRSYCGYFRLNPVMSREAIDSAAVSYFSVMH